MRKVAWAASLFEEWRMWRNLEEDTNQNISQLNPTLKMLTKDELDFLHVASFVKFAKLMDPKIQGRPPMKLQQVCRNT